MDDKELITIIDNASENFQGDLTNLSRAIGMVMIGRRFGWKVLFLVYNRSTIRKYEKILSEGLSEGFSIQDALPPEGDLSKKSVAYNALKSVNNFWKAVKGEIPGIRSTKTTTD